MTDRPFTLLAKRLAAPFIPTLRDLPNEALDQGKYRLLLLGFVWLVVSAVIVAAGALVAWLRGDSYIELLLFSGGSVVAAVFFAVILGQSIEVERQSIEVERTRAQLRAQLDELRAGSTPHRDLQASIKERDADEDRLFQGNLGYDFVLKEFEWSGISCFEDGYYRFAPRVNVLLGKNGYGKTLMFRSLVALLQRNEKYSGLLFPPTGPSAATKDDGSPARLIVTITRGDKTEKIERDATYFLDRVGKIPMLAIPDSRFINRMHSAVDAALATPTPLYRSSATQFLTQEPYEKTVQELLTSLGLDFGFQPGERAPRTKKGLEKPIFQLIERVVRELTEDEGFGFADIKRVETKLEIGVRTSGSGDTVIPIQAASQGTLSVLVIVGLIFRFLQSLDSARLSPREDDVARGSAIVLIDEIDAHLHPAWQQRIIAILTREFPNVQFIVAAHSPLIVAGCDQGEVSVLRRRKTSGSFFVDPLPEDFLGAKLDDLYRRLFEIEQEDDRLYLEYSTKGLGEEEQRKREMEIRELDAKQRRSREEDRRLSYLQRESRLVARAAAVRRQRLEEERNKADLDVLQSEIEQLQRALQAKDSEIEGLQRALQAKDSEITMFRQATANRQEEA